MKNSLSGSVNNEIEVLERSFLYRKQCIEALDKFKEKENKLKVNSKIKVEVIPIPYGYITVYRRNKNKR